MFVPSSAGGECVAAVGSQYKEICKYIYSEDICSSDIIYVVLLLPLSRDDLILSGGRRTMRQLVFHTPGFSI